MCGGSRGVGKEVEKEMRLKQGPDYEGPFSKIKSFGPQTNSKRQSLKCLEIGNDEIEWGMGWREKAWRYGDWCEAIVGTEVNNDEGLN